MVSCCLVFFVLFAWLFACGCCALWFVAVRWRSSWFVVCCLFVLSHVGPFSLLVGQCLMCVVFLLLWLFAVVRVMFVVVCGCVLLS